MDAERDVDLIDAWLREAEKWEPPAGYALRVSAAARVDPRRVAALPPIHASRHVRDSLAAYLRAATSRGEGTLWVLRQYVSFLR